MIGIFLISISKVLVIKNDNKNFNQDVLTEKIKNNQSNISKLIK